MPRSAIAPLGLTMEGGTKFKLKVENATLKNYSVMSGYTASYQRNVIQGIGDVKAKRKESTWLGDLALLCMPPLDFLRVL